MATEKLYRGYVRTSTGGYFVQLPDPESRFGFSICDDDQTFEGGFGVDDEWEAVPEGEVPEQERERLGWLLNA